VTARPTRRRILLAGLSGAGLGLLGGCGFQPLYKARGDAKQSASVRTLAAIDIAPISDRAGQVLRNELRDRLTPRGTPARPRYRLEASLTETTSDVVILRDATATFAKYVARVKWTLVDLSSNAPALSGDVRRTSSFPIAASEFASLEAEKDARDRAMAEIAEDIRLRLGIYFSKGALSS